MQRCRDRLIPAGHLSATCARGLRGNLAGSSRGGIEARTVRLGGSVRRGATKPDAGSPRSCARRRWTPTKLPQHDHNDPDGSRHRAGAAARLLSSCSASWVCSLQCSLHTYSQPPMSSGVMSPPGR